ncbi:MAG: thiamine pyrophosphate-binding protein [Chloroflexi bacterium]|nr:thiamine pyrophosphate-binding protein [Chloroflexota bacterium]
MTRYGSDLIVDLIHRYEISYVSLNPGSTFRGLHDSLVNYGGNRSPMILCPHEKIAVLIAHGYAKVTGRPMAAIVHDTVGLLHCTMGLYYTYLDRVPLILLGAGGPLDPGRRRPYMDWIHSSTPQSLPIREFTKWDRTPVNAQDVVDSFARAYRVATQEPCGPVYICFDQAFQLDPLQEDVQLPNPARLGPGTLAHPDPAALDELADLLAKAENPIIIAGYSGRNHSAFFDLVKLAEACGAPVVDLNHRLNFPTGHPLNVSFHVTHTLRYGQSQKDLLGQADLILAVDVKELWNSVVQADPKLQYGTPTEKIKYIIPPHCKIAEIGYRDINISRWSDEFQQIVPVDLQIIADSSVALPLLAERVQHRVSADTSAQVRVRARAERIGALHRAARAQWREEARMDWDATPIATARLASEIWEVIRNEDWVLTANTLANWAFKLWDFDRPERHPGISLGTGTQIGISLGVALAYKGTGKVVVDVQPDGDLMFDPGALWVATHERIPLLVVMFNNRAYYQDYDHQIALAKFRGTPVENAHIGQAIDDPPPDFANLARSFGWHAEGPIEHPSQVGGALRRALEAVKHGQPALVDTVTRYR